MHQNRSLWRRALDDSGRQPRVADRAQERDSLNFHARIMTAIDRVMSAAVVVLIFGSAVAFGGAVWWFRPALIVVTFVLVASKLA
jgi:hypothetical protein